MTRSATNQVGRSLSRLVIGSAPLRVWLPTSQCTLRLGQVDGCGVLVGVGVAVSAVLTARQTFTYCLLPVGAATERGAVRLATGKKATKVTIRARRTRELL